MTQPEWGDPVRCFYTGGGACLPEENYMVDVTEKAAKIIQLIDRHHCFAISRPRQYGKTSMLAKLEEMLTPRCCVFSVSFEGNSRAVYRSEEAFVSWFMDTLSEQMKEAGFPDALVMLWNNPETAGADWEKVPLACLQAKIAELCRLADRPVVLLMDEIDGPSDTEAFLKFLGALRENDLAARAGRGTSFQSVILAGVSDIRTRNGRDTPVSPWNNAADFDVDMSFSAEEISGMLHEYEADHRTGMDVGAVSQEIRRLTGGYPYIVSWICQWLDERGGGNWTAEGVKAAGKAFLRSNCTLLNTARREIQTHPELYDALTTLLFFVGTFSYAPPQREIELGILHGILMKAEDDQVKISNPLLEEYIGKYIVDSARDLYMNSTKYLSQSDCVSADGRLNMPMILDEFQFFLLNRNRINHPGFMEREGRLLFLAFLDPVINGTGNMYIERQTLNETRMDVVVTWRSEEYIVEMKVWNGQESRREGIARLEEYLDSRGAEAGYLISCCLQKSDRGHSGWLSSEESGKPIYEVVIPTGDDQELSAN